LKKRPTNKLMNTFRALKIFTGKLNKQFKRTLKVGISVLPPTTMLLWQKPGKCWLPDSLKNSSGQRNSMWRPHKKPTFQKNGSRSWKTLLPVFMSAALKLSNFRFNNRLNFCMEIRWMGLMIFWRMWFPMGTPVEPLKFRRELALDGISPPWTRRNLKHCFQNLGQQTERPSGIAVGRIRRNWWTP